MKDLTTDVTNALEELVEKNLVDLETLKNKGLNSERCYTYLYSIDCVTPSELNKFNGTNKSSTYNKYNKLTNNTVKKTLNFTKRKISIPPDEVFSTMQDYYEFLRWRAENKKDVITISQAMAMSGISRRKITKSIRSNELRATVFNGEYKIPRVLFDIYMKKIMGIYKKQKVEIDRKKDKIDRRKVEIDRKKDKIDRRKVEIDRKISALQNFTKQKSKEASL